MDAPLIRIAGLEVTLDPCSPFLTTSLLALSRDGDGVLSLALTFAALGLTWPKKAATPARWPKPWRFGVPLPEYGQAVCDALVAAGASVPDACGAASSAYSWALSAIPSDEEIARVGESSEPAPAGTSEP